MSLSQKQQRQIKQKKINDNKRFFITIINNQDKHNETLTYLKTLPYNYILSCKEYDEDDDYEIYNIYIQFENTQILDKEKIKNISIEISTKGSIQLIEEMKDDNEILFEDGTPYLCGNIRIKDIYLIKNYSDTRHLLPRFKNMYMKLIKDGSISPGLCNTKKNIIIFNNKVEMNKNKKYQKYTSIYMNKDVIYNLSSNVIIEKQNFSNDLLDKILNKFNKPLLIKKKIFYPSFIENIVIINDELDKNKLLEQYKDMINNIQ